MSDFESGAFNRALPTLLRPKTRLSRKGPNLFSEKCGGGCSLHRTRLRTKSRSTGNSRERGAKGRSSSFLHILTVQSKVAIQKLVYPFCKADSAQQHRLSYTSAIVHVASTKGHGSTHFPRQALSRKVKRQESWQSPVAIRMQTLQAHSSLKLQSLEEDGICARRSI
jgi:hypothetical protein